MAELIRKVSINRFNNQMSVNIPKRAFKKIDPTIKFNKDLFVKIKIMKRYKDGDNI
jgi:hypothetical protein